MGKLILYGIGGSAPVRSVLLTLNALDLPFDYKVINLLAKEQLQPEFLRINPQHTLPTLDDNGFHIWDSHAINAYLVSKYGKRDKLYPKALQQRAIIDQRLHYDSSVMTLNLRSVVYPLMFLNETVIPKARIDAIAEVYNTLESIYLKDDDYMAGNELTIVDHHFVATCSTMMVFLDIDAAKYPNLAKWLQRMQQLPYYEKANGKPLQMFVDMVKSKKFTIA